MAAFGLSIGANATSCCNSDGELFRNELGGHTTASLVGFSGRERQLGEAAVAGRTANAKNTVSMVGEVALAAHAELAASPLAAHLPFAHAAAPDGSAVLTLEYGGEAVDFSSLALLGALLGKVRRTSGAEEGAPLAIALPSLAPDAEDAARARLSDAAAIGGWKLIAAPSAAEALGAALARKYPFKEGEEPKRLLVIDVGHTRTTAAVICVFPPPAKKANGEAAEEGEANQLRFSVLAKRSEPLGCAHFDASLFTHFAAQIEAKHGEAVVGGTRRGVRLMAAVERVRKLLSTMGEASATAENLIDGLDVPIRLTRDEMAELLAPLCEKLKACVADVLAAEGLEELHGVEAVGGGMRMPLVQSLLAEALAASPIGSAIAAHKLGAKLDDASLAIGAALIGKLKLSQPDGTPLAGALPAAALAELVAQEQTYAAADAAAAALGARRNEFEGFVLESRGLSGRKHGELVEAARLTPLLDAAEEWLYSEEGEAATLEALDGKLEELRAQVGELTEAYRAKLAEVKAADEAALEAAAAAAAAEKAANGEDEDHDTRRLKYPDRLRLVMKNKEEGTELFQGQNWRPAAARYNKALTHAAKFVDLSPEQREEVNAVKLSLHLNIAQCWLKITDAENHLTQAIRSCDEALELDPNSVKALYRRAFAKEAKGDYDGAKADLKKAGELAPDDTAVPKLMARVDAQLARQKAKEKKMYGKMFG